MYRTIFYSLCLILMIISPAMAEINFNKDRWMLRFRVIDLMPDEDSSVSIGGDVKLGNSFVPEFDISYFWTDNIATELILGTTKHNASATQTGLGELDLGDVMILPPTLTMQYHFMPEEQFRPYAGAGVNYTFFYNEDAGSSITSIDYENNFGVALQAGFDYGLNKHWALNLDVKKLWLSTDISINGGAVTADVDLDPWVFGAGIAYRF